MQQYLTRESIRGLCSCWFKDVVHRYDLADYVKKYDLSDYAKRYDLQDYVRKADLDAMQSNYVQRSEIDEVVGGQMSKYALKSELPSSEDMVSKQQVKEVISQVVEGLSGFTNKDEEGNYSYTNEEIMDKVNAILDALQNPKGSNS